MKEISLQAARLYFCHASRLSEIVLLFLFIRTVNVYFLSLLYVREDYSDSLEKISALLREQSEHVGRLSLVNPWVTLQIVFALVLRDGVGWLVR